MSSSVKDFHAISSGNGGGIISLAPVILGKNKSRKHFGFILLSATFSESVFSAGMLSCSLRSFVTKYVSLPSIGVAFPCLVQELRSSVRSFPF